MSMKYENIWGGKQTLQGRRRWSGQSGQGRTNILAKNELKKTRIMQCAVIYKHDAKNQLDTDNWPGICRGPTKSSVKLS
jgi:hypothetical protein